MDAIASRRSALAGHLRRLGRDAGYRYERGEMLCDGWRCLREAADSPVEITAVLVSAGAGEDALGTLPRPGVPVYRAAEDVFSYISPLKTAQDVLFSCALPRAREVDVSARNLVLDGVQDPGNVGTAIRSAAAFGVDSVILTGPCADPYSPKTARAAMGAVFRENVARTDYGGLRRLVGLGLALYGAAADGAEDIRALDLSRASAAVGSEGAGLAEETLSLCRGRAAIRMEPGTESLNAAVAASIIMWEMYKGAG
ncbi:MAG: RNA methyltransferase [Oscillospiraceae bacterium]|jgi:TrmH family RNA methyltransferase|nr:RNA methyltransferase [Oscillospiraceae bacterium]